MPKVWTTTFFFSFPSNTPAPIDRRGYESKLSTPSYQPTSLPSPNLCTPPPRPALTRRGHSTSSWSMGQPRFIRSALFLFFVDSLFSSIHPQHLISNERNLTASFFPRVKTWNHSIARSWRNQVHNQTHYSITAVVFHHHDFYPDKKWKGKWKEKDKEKLSKYHNRNFNQFQKSLRGHDCYSLQGKLSERRSLQFFFPFNIHKPCLR